MANPESKAAGSVPERRRFPRVPLELRGRFMLPDWSEFDCTVRDISGSGMSIHTDQPVEMGEKIIAYISEIGRLEGEIIRTFEGGFALELTISAFKREKLVRILHELDANAGFTEAQRRHHRFVPEKSGSDFTLPDGRAYPCEVIDMSLSGASIRVGVVPALGTTIYLGKMRGIVSRHHRQGVAIEFVDMPDLGTLADHFGGGSLSGLRDLDA